MAIAPKINPPLRTLLGPGPSPVNPLKDKVWRVGFMGHGARVENVELLAQALRGLL